MFYLLIDVKCANFKVLQSKTSRNLFDRYLCKALYLNIFESLNLLTRDKNILHVAFSSIVAEWSGLTLFRLGGGGEGRHNVPPYRFFSCCAETTCNRLMKLSDF